MKKNLHQNPVDTKLQNCTLKHFHSNKIILRSVDTILYPHTNPYPTLLVIMAIPSPVVPKGMPDVMTDMAAPQKDQPPKNAAATGITFTQLSQDTPLSELFPKVPTTVLTLRCKGATGPRMCVLAVRFTK